MRVRRNWDHVYFAFSEPKSGLDCFNKSGAILQSDRDSILNDLNTCAEAFDLFWIDIHANDFVVDPNPEVTLLPKKFKKSPRLSFHGNCDPERNQNVFASAVSEHFIGN